MPGTCALGTCDEEADAEPHSSSAEAGCFTTGEEGAWCLAPFFGLAGAALVAFLLGAIPCLPRANGPQSRDKSREPPELGGGARQPSHSTRGLRARHTND